MPQNWQRQEFLTALERLDVSHFPLYPLQMILHLYNKFLNNFICQLLTSKEKNLKRKTRILKTLRPLEVKIDMER